MSEAEKQQLLSAARSVRERAWCPYSQFAVGASVLASDGSIHDGCNVENASYGLTLCAERNALAAAVAAGLRPGELLAIAVVADPPAARSTQTAASADWHITPCGACRQVLAEFAAADCVVICGPADAASDTEAQVYRLADLLPEPFGAVGSRTS